ncbi:hypothetical protein CRENBAI_013118 [Crenichthys baileyi]|uniref:Uncharacterized protein n=1 Tax=Crenichthys baileyi TaxID=28760 RepID=A0AAV9QY03_9TELE
MAAAGMSGAVFSLSADMSAAASNPASATALCPRLAAAPPMSLEEEDYETAVRQFYCRPPSPKPSHQSAAAEQSKPDLQKGAAAQLTSGLQGAGSEQPTSGLHSAAPLHPTSGLQSAAAVQPTSERRHRAAQVCLNLLHTLQRRRKRDASAQVIGGPGDALAQVIGGPGYCSAQAIGGPGDASAQVIGVPAMPRLLPTPLRVSATPQLLRKPLRVDVTPQLLLLACRPSRGSVRNWSSSWFLNPVMKGLRTNLLEPVPEGFEKEMLVLTVASEGPPDSASASEVWPFHVPEKPVGGLPPRPGSEHLLGFFWGVLMELKPDFKSAGATPDSKPDSKPPEFHRVSRGPSTLHGWPPDLPHRGSSILLGRPPDRGSSTLLGRCPDRLLFRRRPPDRGSSTLLGRPPDQPAGSCCLRQPPRSLRLLASKSLSSPPSPAGTVPTPLKGDLSLKNF